MKGDWEENGKGGGVEENWEESWRKVGKGLAIGCSLSNFLLAWEKFQKEKISSLKKISYNWKKGGVMEKERVSEKLLSGKLSADRQLLATEIKKAIRDIPDFPKPGIIFKDITTFLNQGKLFQRLIDYWSEIYRGKVDFVVGIESRGFILGSPLAQKLGVGFVPIRKKGKLPGETICYHYQLEYGNDAIEIHRDCFLDLPAPKVVVVDDLIATGGTAFGAKKLLEEVGTEIVAFQFLIELTFLGGGQGLRKEGVPVDALITY